MKLPIVTFLLAFSFFMAGFFAGRATTDDITEILARMFSDDVKEVRQGRIAGAVISATHNATLSEAWESLTSDIVRDYGR